MHIRPKTNHEMIADVAAVAHKTLPHQPDRSALLAIAGELAVNGPVQGEVTRRTNQSEHLYGPEGRVTIPAGTARSLGDPAQYAQHLRAANRKHRDDIVGRRELLQGYGPHETDKQWGAVPLGEGADATVNAVSVGGVVWAQRTNKRSGNEAGTDDRALASIRAKRHNMHALEQLAGVTYESGGETRAEVVPLPDIAAMPLHDLRQVTPDQVKDLVQTVVAAGKADIEIDALFKPDNILYDPVRGFLIWDNAPRARTSDGERYVVPLQSLLMGIGKFLALGDERSFAPKSTADYAVASAKLRARQPIVQAYQDALAALPADALVNESVASPRGSTGTSPVDAIVESCDQMLQLNKQQADQLGDEQWAARDLAQRRKAAAERMYMSRSRF